MTKRKKEKIFSIEPFVIKTFDDTEFTVNARILVVRDSWLQTDQIQDEKKDMIFYKKDPLGESQVVLFIHKLSKTYRISFLHYLFEDEPYVQYVDPNDYKDKELALIECYNLIRRRKKLLYEKGMKGRELLKHRKRLFSLRNKYRK